MMSNLGRWMDALVRTWLIGHSPRELAAQYLTLTLLTLLSAYSVILMRRSHVIVLSHARALTSTLACSIATLGVHQGLMYLLLPTAGKPGFGRIALYLVALMLSRAIVQLIGLLVDGGASLKDLTRGVEVPFNCNWPLIPRAAIHSLGLVAFSVIATR